MRLTLVSATLATAALLCVSSGRLEAQATGTVRGRVVETGSQQPVSDVQVSIIGTTLGAITNASGEFAIINVPAGEQRIRVRRLGFRAADQAVTVTAGATVTANFTLAPSALSSSRSLLPGPRGRGAPDGRELDHPGRCRGTDREELDHVGLRGPAGKTPGVTILPGSGAAGTAGEIRIRGAGSTSGYQPVVFIDGIRYNISDLGGFSATGGGTAGLAQSAQVTSALNWLNPNDIESIEVIKGPAASTLYGAEAANGVIQIITKKGARGQQQLRWGFRAERGENEWKLRPADNYTTCDAVKQAATVSASDPSPLWPGCQGLPVNTVITGNPMMDDPRVAHGRPHTTVGHRTRRR
jgi:TonB-dependent SusC/RagA subfamily outer membrane receptor